MHATKDDIKATSRLTQQAAFDSLRKTKIRWVSKGFALQAMQATTPSEQLGFCIIASKKTAKSAVLRNRMRRRLRAVALEILPHHAKSGIDYMVVARKDAPTLGIEELRRDMVWCLKRLDLLKDVS
ncbi:MAG: ribonuclease P protein component [Alphaproteobacteria bacterium]|nr:ribonuclease P protein component [Alphaproteobacteria bacterium]